MDENKEHEYLFGNDAGGVATDKAILFLIGVVVTLILILAGLVWLVNYCM